MYVLPQTTMHCITPADATIGFEESSYTVNEAFPQGTTMICVVLTSGVIAPGYSINYTLELNIDSTTQGINTLTYLCPSLCSVSLQQINVIQKHTFSC